MIGAVIITHGSLAASLLEVTESITGRADNVRSISVANTDKTERIREVLASAVKEVDSGGGAIIFTDMFGGTPTNIALSLLSEGKVEVITGVNLPVLIKFIGHRAEKSLHDLAVVLKDYGQKSVVIAGEILKEKK